MEEEDKIIWHDSSAGSTGPVPAVDWQFTITFCATHPFFSRPQISHVLPWKGGVQKKEGYFGLHPNFNALFDAKTPETNFTACFGGPTLHWI